MRRLTELMVAALQEHLATGAPPRIPDYALPLWQVFVELAKDRAMSAHAGGRDMGPMTMEEIAARGQVMGLPLGLRHIHLIRALDRAWRGAPDAPKPELTAEMFDAMF